MARGPAAPMTGTVAGTGTVIETGIGTAAATAAETGTVIVTVTVTAASAVWLCPDAGALWEGRGC